MTVTNASYCVQLLDAVDEAGTDPTLAYVARTRLRRAVIALERGRRGHAAHDSPISAAPPEVRRLVGELRAEVLNLSQPSEALDPIWKADWHNVLERVAALRSWLSAGSAT